MIPNAPRPPIPSNPTDSLALTTFLLLGEDGCQGNGAAAPLPHAVVLVARRVARHVDEEGALLAAVPQADPRVVVLVAAGFGVARVARVDLDRVQPRVGKSVPVVAPVGPRAAVELVRLLVEVRAREVDDARVRLELERVAELDHGQGAVRLVVPRVPPRAGRLAGARVDADGDVVVVAPGLEVEVVGAVYDVVAVACGPRRRDLMPRWYIKRRRRPHGVDAERLRGVGEAGEVGPGATSPSSSRACRRATD
ncbi:hypothetical protein PG994_013707 [Apiospora phragmitis]|uniref:Uncharacterized protein n=1 Tax=Apiospora phragmitis TaxID=2905665 RepID=A0ABR1T9E7_9PEZI